MKNDFLQGSFANVIVQGRPCCTQKRVLPASLRDLSVA